jgi:Domain of unknown function (DUF3823_C)
MVFNCSRNRYAIGLSSKKYGLLPGHTYYARLGVRVNDSYKKYDFSPIVTVTTAGK